MTEANSRPPLLSFTRRIRAIKPAISFRSPSFRALDSERRGVSGHYRIPCPVHPPITALTRVNSSESS